MQVQPLHPEFDYLTVTRAGGIAGAVERVHLDADMHAQVNRFLDSDAQASVDASTAADTIRQLGALVEHGQPVDGSAHPAGGDMYQYQIELGWNGQVYRFHTDGLGVDEALHGTVALADRLLEFEPTAHMQTSAAGGESRPKARTLGMLAPNGNLGTVPPWLQGDRADGATATATATLAMHAPAGGALQQGAWAGHDLAEVDAARSSLNAAVAALRDGPFDRSLVSAYTRDAANALDRAEHAATTPQGTTATTTHAAQPEVSHLLRALHALPAVPPKGDIDALATRYDSILDQLEGLLGTAGYE